MNPEAQTLMSDEIKVAKNGKPWRTEDEARRALAEMELDPKVWGVVPRDGGWALEPHAQTLARQAAGREQTARDARARDAAGEKYFWVVFAARQSASDAENVELSHNGDRITVRRETEVPLPQRFLNVADAAVQRVFEPIRRGSIPYRDAGVIRRRPYRIVREARQKDFVEYMESGNNVTRQAILASAGRASDDAGV